MEKNRLPGKVAPYYGLTGLLLIILLTPAAQAARGLIDSANGVLRVSGTLTESPCHLEMNSIDQSVLLKDVSTDQLQKVGDRGTPVAVTLRLQDCLRSASKNRDLQGNLTWSANQPAVSLTFTGVKDDSNPQLFMVRGAGGIGLRLTDAFHHDVQPGLQGRPQLLTTGSDELIYYIALERTAASLQAGAYLAYVNFRLSYE